MASAYASGQIRKCCFSRSVGTVETWCLKRALMSRSYSHFEDRGSGAPHEFRLWLDLPIKGEASRRQKLANGEAGKSRRV